MFRRTLGSAANGESKQGGRRTPCAALLFASCNRAPAKARHSRGESPRRVRALGPVTEGNCVAARRGGEQLEVNRRSATRVNPIRPTRAANLRLVVKPGTER